MDLLYYKDLYIDNGCKYIFAYYSDNIWNVVQQKFILNKDYRKNILEGQFIHSEWFQKMYGNRDKIIYMILKVNMYISNTTIEKDMNSLKNPFPTLYDIPPYVSRASFYTIPFEIFNMCLNEIKIKQQDFVLTVRAINNPYDKLKVSIYNKDTNKSNNTLLITFPSFEIPIEYVK